MHEKAFAILLVAGIIALAAAANAGGMGNETINYTYDNSGELVSVSRSGAVNNGVVSNYTYDKASNRTNTNTTGAH